MQQYPRQNYPPQNTDHYQPYSPTPPHPGSFHPGNRHLLKSKASAARRGIIHQGVKYLLAGGAIAIAFSLLVDLRGVLPKATTAVNTATTNATTTDSCQQVVQPKATLSRDQLSQLLTVPERSSKAQIRQVMHDPYCQLPDLQVRAGVTAQREAYPLAFDPQTWFVVLYEGGEYVGYSFSFHR